MGGIVQDIGQDGDDGEAEARLARDFARTPEGARLIQSALDRADELVRARRIAEEAGVDPGHLVPRVPGRGPGPDDETAAERDAETARLREVSAAARDASAEENLDALGAELARRFGYGVQFSFRTAPDRWGLWLTISWVDGPTRAQVERAAAAFQGMGSDDAGPVRWPVYGSTALRKVSPGCRAWAFAALEAAGIRRDPEDPEAVVGVPGDPSAETMEVAGRVVPVRVGHPIEMFVRDLLLVTAFDTDGRPLPA